MDEHVEKAKAILSELLSNLQTYAPREQHASLLRAQLQAARAELDLANPGDFPHPSFRLLDRPADLSDGYVEIVPDMDLPEPGSIADAAAMQKAMDEGRLGRYDPPKPKPRKPRK